MNSKKKKIYVVKLTTEAVPFAPDLFVIVYFLQYLLKRILQ